MKMSAVITDPYEVQKILKCLKRNKALPIDRVALEASGFSFPENSMKQGLPGDEERLLLFCIRTLVTTKNLDS
jgi:hypothetical protein